MKLTPEERIEEVVCAVRFEAFPTWSIDTLLCHPREAMRFCLEVRRRLNYSPGTPTDPQTLKCLLNLRKQGRLKDARRPSGSSSRRRSTKADTRRRRSR